jgi:membrane-associated phospholipid phosphatase
LKNISLMSATTNTGRLQRFVAVSLLVWFALGVYFLISINQRPATTVVMPEWVPFWPGFALPYLSLLLVAWLLPLAIRNPANFRACLRAMLYAFLLVVALWILIPTRLQRPPLPEVWWAEPYRWLAEIDPPHCAMPSGHGIGATAAAWFVGLERPRWRWPLIGMLALGLPSIAFVGQHRPTDILIGTVATVVGIGIGHALNANEHTTT